VHLKWICAAAGMATCRYPQGSATVLQGLATMLPWACQLLRCPDRQQRYLFARHDPLVTNLLFLIELLRHTAFTATLTSTVPCWIVSLDQAPVWPIVRGISRLNVAT
jgi:hypothetical protein